MTNTFKDIDKLEADLWEAADHLRANSKLTSSDYFMPVLGVIFLRHAANRFEAATRHIEADQAAGRMPRRNLLPADYLRRRALWLPEAARYDWIMQQAATSGSDLPKLVTAAMTAIEAEFEPLRGVLPKDYGIFETKVLEDLMRLFNSVQIKQVTVTFLAASTNTSSPNFLFRRPMTTGSSSRPLRWSRPSSTSSNLTTASSSTLPAARVACSSNPAISSSTRAATRPEGWSFTVRKRTAIPSTSPR
jgi:hypothetical protein